MENRIKEYRKAYGMTQAELGKRIGVTASNISSWEVGRTEPTVRQVIQIANVFNCSVRDIFIFEMHYSEEELRYARLKAYAEKLMKLPEPQQKTVEQLIDNLIGNEKEINNNED